MLKWSDSTGDEKIAENFISHERIIRKEMIGDSRRTSLVSCASIFIIKVSRIENRVEKFLTFIN